MQYPRRRCLVCNDNHFKFLNKVFRFFLCFTTMKNLNYRKKYIVLRQETKVIERYIELHINKLYHVIIKLLLSFHAVTRKTTLLYILSTIYFKTYIFHYLFYKTML